MGCDEMTSMKSLIRKSRPMTATALLFMALVSQGAVVGFETVVGNLTADDVQNVFPREYGFQLHRERESSATFLFYGEKANDFTTLNCSPGAVFSIVSLSVIREG